jgi:hypothetical protein
MQNTETNIAKYPNILRFKEKNNYEQSLHSLSIFPYNNNYLTPNFFKIILNFSLKDVITIIFILHTHIKVILNKLFFILSLKFDTNKEQKIELFFEIRNFIILFSVKLKF